MEHVKTPISNSAIPHFRENSVAAKGPVQSIESQFDTCFRVGHVHQNLNIHLNILYKIRPKTCRIAESRGLKQGSCWLWSWRRALDLWGWHEVNTTHVDCYRHEVHPGKDHQIPVNQNNIWSFEHLKNLITSHARLRLYLSLLSEAQIHHDSSMLSWCCCIFCKPHVRLGFLLGSTNSNI